MYEINEQAEQNCHFEVLQMYRKSNEIRKKISDSAMNLFQTKGYSVSISEICDAAGITRSSFYNQFSCKEDILFYLMENANAMSESNLDAFTYADNDFERLWLMVDNRLRIIDDCGPLLTKGLFQLELDQELGIIALTDTIRARCRKLYRNCITQGIVTCTQDPDKVIEYAEHMTHGIIFEWTRRGGSFDLRASSREANEVILGLREDLRETV